MGHRDSQRNGVTRIYFGNSIMYLQFTITRYFFNRVLNFAIQTDKRVFLYLFFSVWLSGISAQKKSQCYCDFMNELSNNLFYFYRQ